MQHYNMIFSLLWSYYLILPEFYCGWIRQLNTVGRLIKWFQKIFFILVIDIEQFSLGQNRRNIDHYLFAQLFNIYWTHKCFFPIEKYAPNTKMIQINFLKLSLISNHILRVLLDIANCTNLQRLVLGKWIWKSTAFH